MEELERKIEEIASNYADREIIVNEEKDENYATMIYAVKFGIKSEIAKQYWQQGLYTEKEVMTMMQELQLKYGLFFTDWFEQNKKK